MTEIARYYCPSCSRQIESDLATARAGVKCPDCQTGFVPEKIETYQEEEIPRPSAPPRVVPKWERIYYFAENLFLLANILVFVGIIALLMAGVQAINEKVSPVAWLALGGSFSLALFLYLLGQIIHIRALLEKK